MEIIKELKVCDVYTLQLIKNKYNYIVHLLNTEYCKGINVKEYKKCESANENYKVRCIGLVRS